MEKKKSLSENPLWIIEFRKTVKKLKKKAGNANKLYSGDQESQTVLMKTGRGNCVAWSKLFRDILSEFDVINVFHMAFYAAPKNDASGHQITLVFIPNGHIWYQSNYETRKFKNIWGLLKYAANNTGWKKKGIKPTEYFKVSNDGSNARIASREFC